MRYRLSATCLAALLVTVIVGCGGINTDPTASTTTTVLVETLIAGTTTPLAVSASVVVQGVRGSVDLTQGWAMLRKVPLGSLDPPKGPLTVTAKGYVTISKQIELSKYSYTPISVEMEPAAPTTTGSLQGRVTSNTTAAPITSAVVHFIAGGVGGATEVSAFTDTDGTYTIGGVPAGLVTVQVQASGYISQTRTAEIFSDATGGGNPDLNFSLLAGDAKMDVHGDVTSLITGAKLAGATVTIASLPAVTTDASGSFTVPQVTVGDETIVATATGYDDYTALISVTPGMDPVHVLMAPLSPKPPSGPYTISGRVTIGDGTDNSGAVVRAFETSRGVEMGSYTTAADGYYWLFVPPGQYRIEASYGTHVVPTTVTLRTGRVLEGIDFALAGG
jgi:large repetitive protein